MCGIIGSIALPGFETSFDVLVDGLLHRGPDARGIFEERFDNRDVRIGHRRLSIIDLSDRANQPFEKDGLVLAFNGEVYNFRELRSQIESSGISFYSNSDTEVILEAWRLWGANSLQRLRGMFAFALYDRRTGSLVLARDPFGIKPLFVFHRGRGFAFASELKALLPILGSNATIDDTGVVGSLLYGWLPNEFCMYRDVKKLLPGTWMERTADGTVTEHVYWDPIVEMANQHTRPFDIEHLRGVLQDTVRSHMVADVPVGALLSGGLDSSVIAALARTQVANIQCFTIAFRPEDRKYEAMPDDLQYARQVAQAADLSLNEILIGPEIVELLPQMVKFLDEPIGEAAAINTFLICTRARELGIKVLLSGVGADEMFGGYRRHYASLLATRYRRLPVLIRAGLIEPLVDLLPAATKNRGYRTFRWAKRFVKFAGLDEQQAFLRSYAFLGPDEIGSVLSPALSKHSDRILSHHAAVYDEGPRDDQVNRMCHADVRLYLSGLLLPFTDRASMAASIEMRVPFVDVEVVRAAFRLRGTDKIRGTETKFALKKAAEAWLMNSIIYRPKALFSAPLRAWVRNDLKKMVDCLLPDGELVRGGYIKRAYIRNIIDDDRRGRADYSKEIWNFLTLEYWLTNQRDRRLASRT